MYRNRALSLFGNDWLRKSGNFHCKNIFVVDDGYENLVW